MSYMLTGVPSQFRAPLFAFEALFGQGGSSAGASIRTAVYLTPILSSGDAVANQIYQVSDESVAIRLFGAGSPGHRMVRKHISVDPSAAIAAIGYPVSSGDGLVSASATVTFAVSSSISGIGVVRVLCAAEIIEVSYNTSDSATTVGAQFAAKINARRHLPFTASNSSGTVTLTAKVPGASQNGIHRIIVLEGASANGLTCTASAATLGSGVDGEVTELEGFQAALSALGSSNSYYIANPIPASTFVSALKNRIASNSAPIKGQRCRGFTALTGALGASAAIAVAQNYERMEFPWQRNSANSPDEIVAWYTAIKQRGEARTTRENFDTTYTDGHILPAPASSSWLDFELDIIEAVNDGLSPIQSTPTGTYLVMGVTSRSKDSTGQLDDFRASEPHRVSVLDELGDILSTRFQLTFRGFALTEDPRNEDGSINLTAIGDLPERVTCPYLFRIWILEQMEEFFTDGRLQNRAEWESGLKTRIDPQNNSRLQASMAGRVIDLVHQATIRVAETTPN